MNSHVTAGTTCAKCGAEVRAGMTRCRQCGHVLTDPPSSAPSAPATAPAAAAGDVTDMLSMLDEGAIPLPQTGLESSDATPQPNGGYDPRRRGPTVAPPAPPQPPSPVPNGNQFTQRMPLPPETDAPRPAAPPSPPAMPGRPGKPSASSRSIAIDMPQMPATTPPQPPKTASGDSVIAAAPAAVEPGFEAFTPPAPQSPPAKPEPPEPADDPNASQKVEIDRESDAPTTGLVKIACKKCDHRFRVKSEKAGHRVKCPKCGAKTRVPGGKQRRSGVHGRESDRHTVFRRLAENLPKKPKTAAGEAWEPKPSLSSRKFNKLTTSMSERLPRKNESLTDSVHRRQDAIKALGESKDGRAWEPLVEQLSDDSITIRTSAVEALGKLGDPRAVSALVTLFDSDVADLRRRAVVALGDIGDRRGIRPMMLVSLDDPQLRLSVSGAVTSMGDMATPELMDLLNDDEPGIVLESVVLLGRLRDAKAVKALEAVIETKSALFRSHAAESLGQISDPRGAPILSKLLEDEDAGVRVSAAGALVRMPGSANVKALVRALRDPDEDVRRLVATAIGEVGDKRAGNPLAVLLQDPNERVRAAVTLALGKIGDERALEPLLEMMQSEDDNEVLKAITACRSFRDPRAMEMVLEYLHHERAVVRQRAAETLGGIGDAVAAERIEGVLRSDRASEVRVAAAKALGEIRDPGSIEALETALDDEFQVRCRAVVALGQIGDEASLPPLMSMLKDGVPEVRYQAALAIGNLGHPNGKTPLEPLLEDENAMVRRGAAKALIALGDARGDALLEQAAKPVRRKKSKARKKTLSSGGSPFSFDFKKLKELNPAELLVMLWPESPKVRAITASVAAVPVLLIAAFFFLSGSGGAPILRGMYTSADYDGTGQKLVVGRSRGVIEVWDVAGSRLLKQHVVGFAKVDHVVGSVDGSGILYVAGNKVFFLGADGIPTEIDTPPGGVRSFVPSTGHTHVAVLANNGITRIWRTSDGSASASMQLPKGATCVSVSEDGTKLVAGTDSGVSLYNVASPGSPLHFSTGDRVTAVAISTNDSEVFAGTAEGKLAAWSIGTETPKATTKIGGSVVSLHPTSASVIVFADSTYEWNGLADAPREIGPTLSAIGDATGVRGNDEESGVTVFDLESGKSTGYLDVRVN